MKSFAAKVRDGLTREDAMHPSPASADLAELSGLALACGTVTLAGGGSMRLAMRVVHAGTGRRIVRLVRGALGVTPGLRILRASRFGGRTFFEITLGGEDARVLMHALELSPLASAIPRKWTKSQRRRGAFLKGVFLGCGTVADPQREYRMEFRFASETMAKAFMEFLCKQYDLAAGFHCRRGEYIVYCNGRDDIITGLSVIGAHGAVLEFENVRITKDARNRANRAANCDAGNITRMVSAAEKQLQAIDVIERTIGLEALPDVLREAAVERKKHADVSLEALGAMLDPPVGKSGVKHRLSRIEAMARSILQTEKEGES